MPSATFAFQTCERQVGDQMYYITELGNGYCIVDVWYADENGFHYLNTMTGLCEHACLA